MPGTCGVGVPAPRLVPDRQLSHFQHLLFNILTPFLLIAGFCRSWCLVPQRCELEDAMTSLLGLYAEQESVSFE